jgi:hypothetical protein
LIPGIPQSRESNDYGLSIRAEAGKEVFE